MAFINETQLAQSIATVLVDIIAGKQNAAAHGIEALMADATLAGDPIDADTILKVIAKVYKIAKAGGGGSTDLTEVNDAIAALQQDTEALTSQVGQKASQADMDMVLALIGIPEGDADVIVNAVREMLEAFATFPEGTDIWAILNGKVPTSRTITINGTALDLSADRVWNIPVPDVTGINSDISTIKTELELDQTYDLFIASYGSNKLKGNIKDAPVLDVARLQTLALAHGNGVRIKSLDQQEYRDALDLPTLNNVVIDGGFATLNAADVVTGWTQPDNVTYPNVWSKAIAHEMLSSEDRLIVLEDGEPLSHRTTIVDVNTNAGSRYILNGTALGSNNPATVYIHATGSGDPNSNGKTYEVSVRQYGLEVGDNATIRQLRAENGGNNYGSIKSGSNTLLERSFMKMASRHHVVAGSGTIRDCIGYKSDVNIGTGQIAFTIYKNTPLAGDVCTFERVHVLDGMPDGVKTPMGGFYMHGGTASNNFPAVIIKECSTRKNLDASFAGYGDSFELVNSYAKEFYRYCFPVCNTLTMRRNMGNVGTSGFLYCGTAPANALALNATINNNAVYSTGSLGVSYLLVPPGTYNISNESLYLADPSFILDIRDNATANFNYNVVRVNTAARVIALSAAATYTGDHNIFTLSSAGEFKTLMGGVVRTTLADWQTVSGQDVNSVYVTVAQQATLFLGDPATGDFRINPSATVTGGDGTIYTGTFPDGTPLANAGVQEHWNLNTRAIVAGAPTAWPVPPVTEEEGILYTKYPEGWDFYA